jgi:hypothetical protein
MKTEAIIIIVIILILVYCIIEKKINNIEKYKILTENINNKENKKEIVIMNDDNKDILDVEYILNKENRIKVSVNKNSKLYEIAINNMNNFYNNQKINDKNNKIENNSYIGYNYYNDLTMSNYGNITSIGKNLLTKYNDIPVSI